MAAEPTRVCTKSTFGVSVGGAATSLALGRVIDGLRGAEGGVGKAAAAWLAAGSTTLEILPAPGPMCTVACSPAARKTSPEI